VSVCGGQDVVKKEQFHINVISFGQMSENDLKDKVCNLFEITSELSFDDRLHLFITASYYPTM